MRKKKLEKIKKDSITIDCWDLDYAFLNWLREHLPVYLKDASSIVDLEYYKFKYNDKEYTQKEIIERMIYLLNAEAVLEDDMWDETYVLYVNEILDLWKLVFQYMWW